MRSSKLLISFILMIFLCACIFAEPAVYGFVTKWQPEKIREYIEKNPSQINTPAYANSNMPLLAAAIYNNDNEMLKYLISKGADVNQVLQGVINISGNNYNSKPVNINLNFTALTLCLYNGFNSNNINNLIVNTLLDAKPQQVNDYEAWDGTKVIKKRILTNLLLMNNYLLIKKFVRNGSEVQKQDLDIAINQ